MSRVIILEGPDGAGKSTLGTTLANHLGINLSHDGGPSTDANHALERIQSVFGFEDCIRDRSTLFSDLIYKVALGREPFVPQEQVDEYVKQVARVVKPLVIFVRPPMDVIFANIAGLDRVKAHKPPEYIEKLKVNLPKIVEQYDKATARWAALGLSIVHYDYTKTNLTSFLQAVDLYWERG